MPVDKFGRMSDTKTKDTGVSLTYINNNYVRSDGETPLTGSLDMRGNTIYNVADPVNPQYVVTKVYVDNTKGSGVIGKKIGDSVSIKENLDFLGKQKIKNLPEPVDDNDAVNKKYVDGMDNLKSAFTLLNGGYEAKGTLYMRKNKLGGLREPIMDGEAATKKYVDDTTKNLFLDENDNIAFGLNVDMDGNKIFSLPEPEQDNEPATKKYVDDLQTQYIDKRGNIKFDRNINVGNNRIFSLKDPKKDYEATNKKYVDDTITKRLQEEKDNFLPQDPATKEYVDEAVKQLAGGDLLVSKEGVFIKANGHYRATAPLDIDNHKMENLPDPVDDKDAVNKKYIDGIVENLTLKQGLIRENGGFNLVDSYINMNFNNIRNVGLPKDEADAVPKSFVDSSVDSLKETTIKPMREMLIKLGQTIDDDIKKIKHLITATASYHGDLIKDSYQFTWNKENVNHLDQNNKFNGFLVPGSGRIKKFILLETGLKINTPELKTFLDFINFDFGLKKSFPMFTLVLIRHEQEPLDIGTLYFHFETRFSNTFDDIIIKQSFKFNSNFEEEILRTVEAKDIINIRSEFSNLTLNKQFRTFTQTKGYNLKNIDDDFFTYLATVLIELDLLDD